MNLLPLTTVVRDLPLVARPHARRVFLALSVILALAGVFASEAVAEKKPSGPSSVQSIFRNADLLVACESGDAETARKLLKEGVDPNTRRSSGATALSYAVAGRHTEVVRVLIAGKADPNQASFGLLPLFLAAENGDLETVRVLLKAGADVNAPLKAVDEEMKVRDGDTPLIAAASPGVPAAVAKALLASGAKVNARADNGKTALIQAVASENIEVLRVLLGARPDLQARMAPPDDLDALTLAVGKSSTAIAALLINAGANVEVKLDGEVSLLEFAILSEQPQVADLLRKAGAKEPTAERLGELRKAAAES